MRESTVATLYERDYGYLRRIASRYVSAQEADDVVQDAFVSALINAKRFRRESSSRTWLHRIVVNASIDRYRRMRHRVQALRSAVHVDCRWGQRLSHHMVDSLALRSAIRTLPSQLRAVCLLYGLVGLSHREIACALRIPEGTSKWRLTKAREQLGTSMRLSA
jgi:RNA polymerase sigma-70 factor (ECF subfamily)